MFFGDFYLTFILPADTIRQDVSSPKGCPITGAYAGVCVLRLVAFCDRLTKVKL